MGGIGLQEFFIVVFLCLAIGFHVEMIKVERTGILQGTPKSKWRQAIYPLYLSLAFITARIIFRLFEFSGGEDTSNPVPYHEWYAYAFDAVPMLLAILCWNLLHPGRIIRGPDAKLPPGFFRRYLCCCCRKRKQAHEPFKMNGNESSRSDILLENRNKHMHMPGIDYEDRASHNRYERR
jgi:RTA1 like protein